MLRRILLVPLLIAVSASTALGQVQISQEKIIVQHPITFMHVEALLLTILATEGDVHLKRVWLNHRETEPCVYLPIRFGEQLTFASEAEVIRKRGLIHRLAELDGVGISYKEEHVLQLGDEVVVQHYSEHCGASIIRVNAIINGVNNEFAFDPATLP